MCCCQIFSLRVHCYTWFQQKYFSRLINYFKNFVCHTCLFLLFFCLPRYWKLKISTMSLQLKISISNNVVLGLVVDAKCHPNDYLWQASSVVPFPVERDCPRKKGVYLALVSVHEDYRSRPWICGKHNKKIILPMLTRYFSEIYVFRHNQKTKTNRDSKKAKQHISRWCKDEPFVLSSAISSPSPDSLHTSTVSLPFLRIHNATF